MSSHYPLSKLCELAEISRAGYYKWKHSGLAREQRQNRDADVKAHLLHLHRLHPYFGAPRLQIALRREGLMVNHKKVRRLMRELSIRSVIRRKRPFAGRTPSVCFANVLNRDFTSEAPGQKLVTDVTYVRTGNTFVYLSVVMDLYNNEVKAWALSERNDLKLVTDTMDQLDNQPGLLHSDQGFQYTTKTYAHLLQRKGLTGSHSRRGNCFDNACVESCFFPSQNGETVFGTASNARRSPLPHCGLFDVLQRGTVPAQTKQPFPERISGKGRRLRKRTFLVST
jgi:putative transposase